MRRSRHRSAVAIVLVVASLGLALSAFQTTLGGPLPGPLPIFPRNNWWNIDISRAPVDPNSASFISFVGTTRRMHPDFGGQESPGSVAIYGFPYVVVDGAVPKQAVQFRWPRESDGVDRATNTSVPFYPIPPDAATQAHWIEGGQPGNVDLRSSSDRHLLIVDRDRRHLYELYNVFFDGTRWHAGSGAFFDLNSNARRPDGWTSADAAGLAILPGLLTYEDVYGPNEITHALRVTVRATNGYVFPASHQAGSTAGALPMGARLRLKASVNLSGFSAPMQKIFRAMQRYGLIVADNGSDLYVSGTFDTRWNNDLLNPAFAAIRGSDFEVVKLGYQPPAQVPANLDLDTRSDLTVFRPSTGEWFTSYSSQGFGYAGWTAYQWGWPGDRPVPADFDGDGRMDLVVYRPSVGTWYVRLSGSQPAYASWVSYQWGWPDDVPVSADFDGDGKSDVVVFRPSTATWYVRFSSGPSGGWQAYQWGAPGDVPLSADFDGDSKADLAVYRPSTGEWLVKSSVNNYSDATATTYPWGLAGDQPVAADFDGDGRTDVVVFRPATGTWYLRFSGGEVSYSTWASFQWGWPGDIPLANDLDGDGRADLTVWRPTTAEWFTLYSSSNFGGAGWTRFAWGISGDVPIGKR